MLPIGAWESCTFVSHFMHTNNITGTIMHTNNITGTTCYLLMLDRVVHLSPVVWKRIYDMNNVVPESTVRICDLVYKIWICDWYIKKCMYDLVATSDNDCVHSNLCHTCLFWCMCLWFDTYKVYAWVSMIWCARWWQV